MADGPPSGSPTRSRQPGPSPRPGDVRNATRGTRRRASCGIRITHRRASDRMSGAPPLPGSRDRRPPSPTTSVEFTFPKRSTSAPPRIPRSTRPAAIMPMTSSVVVADVAPKMFGGSPIVNSNSRAASSRISPFSYKATARGAWSDFATRYERRGSRVPTNTVSPSWISRAARSTIRSRGASVELTRASRLLAGKLGRALLDVRREPFLGVVAREELLLELALDGERLAERNLEPRLDRALDAPDRLRGLVRRQELLRVFEHLRVEILRLEHVVHQAHRESILEREGVAGRHHLDGARLPDQPSHALRAARSGQNAERHLGKPEFARVLLRDPNVGRHRDFEAAADAVAVQCRDHELGRLLEAIQRLVRVEAEVVLEDRIHGLEHVDVRAGAEELLARAA